MATIARATYNIIKATDGADGRGINGIQEYYLASSLSSGVTTSTSGWQTTMPTLTTVNKYLWNYEKITYSDNTTYSTAPAIIGTMSSDGRGISSIVENYLATASATGVTTSTSGWTTSVQTVSNTKKYLWNYEIINYTTGVPTTTTPVIIGVYGDKGDNGTDGADGTSIWIVVSPDMIVKRGSGVYPSPTVITAYGRKKVGNGTETHTGLILKLEASTTGATWNQIGTTYTDSGSITSFPNITTVSTYAYYRVSLLSGSTIVASKTLNVYEESDVAKNDIAVRLGYANYTTMEAAYSAGKTIIEGGIIRTGLIDIDFILSKALNVSQVANIVGNVFNESEVVINSDYGLIINGTTGTTHIRQSPLPSISSLMSQASGGGSNPSNQYIYGSTIRNDVINNYTIDSSSYSVCSNKSFKVNTSYRRLNFNYYVTRTGSIPFNLEGKTLYANIYINFYDSVSAYKIGSQVLKSIYEVDTVDSNVNSYIEIPDVLITPPIGTTRYKMGAMFTFQPRAWDNVDELVLTVTTSEFRFALVSTSSIMQLSPTGLGFVKNTEYFRVAQSDESSESSKGVMMQARYRSINNDSPIPFLLLQGRIYPYSGVIYLYDKMGYLSYETLSLVKNGTGVYSIGLGYAYNVNTFPIVVSNSLAGSVYSTFVDVSGEMTARFTISPASDQTVYFMLYKNQNNI